MRLQHLEINGFKSFPERAELAFSDGVTAIVGPNGCGKSNVIDAITWVLGEQSARSLRGERMEDVIFGGSDARKPTAAAEVRLQLSAVAASLGGKFLRHGNGHGNGHGLEVRPQDTLRQASPERGSSFDQAQDDRNRRAQGPRPRDPGAVLSPSKHGDGAGGDELRTDRTDESGASDAQAEIPTLVRDVEVGRRLYRSGESEYLLDGRVCRLRDIQDLLMDSGVGVKAYAVIEQGKIGQILGARPTERRLLIEEAAGITKYKTRRRAAELKLEAAQQNLTRIDDIIYELESQRGALKRQAAKARRYRKLREELRRWEKVLFTHRYRTLTQAIEDDRRRLEAARAREQAAAARLAAAEGDQERLRMEVVERETKGTAAREAAHAGELAVGRLEQQIEFENQQLGALSSALANGESERLALEARRTPARLALEQQIEAEQRCRQERDQAAERLRAEETACLSAHAALEGFESDVEAARSEVFAAINAATTLRHVIDNAAAGRNRIGAELAKLDAESADVRVEASRIAVERQAASEAVAGAREALDANRATRASREAELGRARAERARVTTEIRTTEQELATLTGRLRSLEELQAVRAEYNDAARLVLTGSGGRVAHVGSVADHIEVDRRYERAVEASLGDLLQYVVVAGRDDAIVALKLAREVDAGRCGFLILGDARPATGRPGVAARPPAGLVALVDSVRLSGPGAAAIRHLLEHRWIATSFAEAAEAAEATNDPIATLDGEVFRGAALLYAGGRDSVRGILATKGEIREFEARVQADEAHLTRRRAELDALETEIAASEGAIRALVAAEHEHEKTMVGLELQIGRTGDETARLTRKQEVIAIERRKAEEERDGLDSRQMEARQSIARLEAEQRAAEERFMSAQRRLLEARASVDEAGRRVAEAKAAQAALAERTAALTADIRRLEDAGAELESRIHARTEDNARLIEQHADLEAAVAESRRRLDQKIAEFQVLRERVRMADEEAADLRSRLDQQDSGVRDLRHTLERARAEVNQLEVTGATVEADLSHLGASCADALQLTLDEVQAEVCQLEQTGQLADATVFAQGDDDGEEPSEAPGSGTPGVPVPGLGAEGTSTPGVPDPEEAIAELRAKIDRLGPVNMMAIDQFDELEQRYAFLTSQRKDLVDSIVATGEAIKRIDKTTRERFREAFTAVNEHFQGTFATLFGGGRAGLILLDEDDLLESGVDIIAQPPGKRLQNVQLLSGGEKALTAMALMFAIFKYKPSPFCLLDEIDAPLDDANISRFLEMLRGMQTHTQFILVTHNRKTMEIATRLYGVTMEEPGVSKLISVELN